MPRYTCVATADLTDTANSVRLSGRVTEISRKGCYLDILNTLPVGTVVQLHVSRDRGAFVSLGKILYVQEGIGMGIAFLDPTDDQLKILDSWLADLDGVSAP